MANRPGKVTSILADMIRLIEEGEYGRAGLVPTRIDLAKHYRTTNATINDVFVFLHAMGYVRQKGRNVVVNPTRIVLPALVPSFDKHLLGLGLTPYMDNVGDPEVTTLDPERANAFELPEGTKIIRRLRVQGEDREGQHIPFRLTETSYLFDLAEPYLPMMTSDPLFVVIDQIRKDTGKSIATSRIKLLTRFPTEQEQQLLEIPLHTPVIELFRVSLSGDGTIIMFSRIVLISYRFTISIDANTKL